MATEDYYSNDDYSYDYEDYNDDYDSDAASTSEYNDYYESSNKYGYDYSDDESNKQLMEDDYNKREDYEEYYNKKDYADEDYYDEDKNDEYEEESNAKDEYEYEDEDNVADYQEEGYADDEQDENEDNSEMSAMDFMKSFFRDATNDESNSDGYYNGKEADALASIFECQPEFFASKPCRKAKFPPALKGAMLRRLKKSMAKYSKKATKKELKKRQNNGLTTVMALTLYKKYGFPALLLTGGLGGGKGGLFGSGKNSNLLPFLLLTKGGGFLGGRHRHHDRDFDHHSRYGSSRPSLQEQKKVAAALQEQIREKEGK